LPTLGRASHAGTRRGGFAPSARAYSGSHSETGAGSSSTMLKIAGPSADRAATVASAASRTWTNDHIPVPAPTTGNQRRRTIRPVWPSREYAVSGP
jgi:hypothetical protein